MLQDGAVCKGRKSDQINAKLKHAILDGHYKPGDKLPPEAEIARQYHVSKVSAREALREMESDGLIEKKRGIFGGSFVTEPGSEKMVNVVINSYLFGGITMRDLAEFRRILEPELAKLAAQRRHGKDLALMEESIKKIRISIEKGSPDRNKAIDFHRLIADACHNPFISSLMEAVVNLFQQVLAKEPDLETAKKDVENIELFYQCIKAQDGEKAQTAMAQHFDTLEKIIKHDKKTSESHF